MKVYRDISEFRAQGPLVLTLGAFDGVHRGHHRLLEDVRERALAAGYQSLALTFDPPPRLLLEKDTSGITFLSSPEEKIRHISASGIRHLMLLKFTHELAQTIPEEFVRHYLLGILGARIIVIGYDHHFGKGGSGNVHTLKAMADAHGFEVAEVNAETYEGMPLSATRIREAIMRGDLASGNAMLGYGYTFSGTVVEGRKLGHLIGFPTANILPDYPWKLVPADGVYAVRIQLDDQSYGGMCNIGMRPTVGGKDRTIEVNIFDFCENIYGRKLTLEFIKKVRDEERFGDLAELQAQISRDKTAVSAILG